MANALISRQSVIGVATEDTAGTGETLVDADGAMNCYDATYTPDITMSERPSQGTYDANIKFAPGARTARIGFRTDIISNNSSPLWFARCLLHAGFTISSGVATAVGSAGTSTASVGLFRDGVLYKIEGAAVTSLRIDFESGMPIYAAIEYMGKYVSPSSTSLLAPTYPTVLPDRYYDSGDFTLNGSSRPIFSGSVIVENDVAMRPDPTDPTGYLHAQITRQVIRVEAVAEATLTSSWNDFASTLLGTAQSIVFTSETSRNLTITVPNAQYMVPGVGDTNGIANHTLTWHHTGSTAATIACG